MNNLRFFFSRIAQETQMQFGVGEIAAIVTLLTVLGTILNLIYTSRNNLVIQQQGIIENLTKRIDVLEKDLQDERNLKAIEVKTRIGFELENQRLTSRLDNMRHKYESAKQKLTAYEKKRLRTSRKKSR